MTNEDVKRLTADSNGAVAMMNVHSLAFKTFTFFHCIDILTDDQRLIWGIFSAMLNSFFSVSHSIVCLLKPPTFKPFTNVLTAIKNICEKLAQTDLQVTFSSFQSNAGRNFFLFYIRSKIFRLSKKIWF